MWADDLAGRIDSGFAYWGSDGSGLSFRVHEGNVMEAARIVMAEAERFRRRIESHRAGLRVYPMGGDPVSREAARVLNEKFSGASDSYLERYIDYAEMLEQLARQIGEAARTYGRTEEQITDVFEAAARDVGVV